MGNTLRQLAAALLLPGAIAGAIAADLPTYKLELNDGKINTRLLTVPAGSRFKIEIVNKGKTAAEFESLQLRKEKVLAPGADSFVVLGPLSPGQYKFYDEFHMATTQGVIVVK
ncbi:cupredoxin domain-containing protein [Vogesella facilis]|uniref:Cupredoxin domain-containing protein n=1 Tax=Vogesella facilis TaxID=1655232 RepID=A0ABV7RFA4_9NEIS